MTSVLIDEGNLDKYMQKQSALKMQGEDHNLPIKWENLEQTLLLLTLEDNNKPNYWFHTSYFQHSERTYICAYPPRLQYFIITSLAK